MRTETKKHLKIGVSAFLILLFLFTLIFQMMLSPSGSERYFSGEAQAYYESLLEAGFPQDYALALTELHLLHPTWTFRPLLITEIDSRYTWEYVIDRETAEEDINLISKSNTYQAYWHETNRNEPETGYYQPSRATVEYFMDPRNFLSEADIFQFFDLVAAGSDSADMQAAVSAVLSGTFMENATLENGDTYAAYFCRLGRELGIDPVYLAVKVRQEQGVAGTSPIISGTCGSLLNDYYQNQTQTTDSGKAILPPSDGYTEAELLALNGYYNYFNINATGTGVFEIYEKAMKRAKTGTAAMSDVWDSPSWDRRWKALYGGAYFLKNSYIDSYQSTIYLQKFNVDARSGSTFSKQYMQSIFGAMSEGRLLYQSLAAIDVLDENYSFLIPVYEKMPAEAASDPANGTCARTATAGYRYTLQNELTSPDRLSATGGAIYTGIEAVQGTNLKLSGSAAHSYGVEYLEYRWDSGEWLHLANGKNLNHSLPVDFSAGTSHILTIRGRADFDENNSDRKCNSYFLFAVLYVDVIPPPTVTVSFSVANTRTEKSLPMGTQLTLPTDEADDFAGWLGSDGSFLPSGASIEATADITYTALFLELEQLEGAALSLLPEEPYLRFFALLREDHYNALIRESGRLKLSATLFSPGADALELSPVLRPSGVSNRLSCFADTPSIERSDYKTPYTLQFSATLTYSNGTQKTIFATGEPFSRSALEVATAALTDTQTFYTPEETAYLQSILEQS